MPSLPLSWLDGLLAPAPDPAQVGWLGRYEYAHRGLHSPRVAENSPTAFARAMTAGLGIECDVRLSRDRRAMVFHDRQLDRLTSSTGKVVDRTVAELTQIPLAVGGESIPTLRDVLEQVGGRVPLLLELKVDSDTSVTLLCRAVRRDLEGYRGPVAVMSFDPRVSHRFATRMPDLVRGLVITEQDRRTFGHRIGRHAALWRARPHFLAYDVRDLPGSFPGVQRSRGLPLLTWTVNSPEARVRAQEYADAPIAEGRGLAESVAAP